MGVSKEGREISAYRREKAFLDGPVNELCAMINDFEITHEMADMPPEVWQFLKKHKFFA
ncbi:acyl-CoA dehydrogenase [Vibrio ishigakensis]|uniref:Acyl-CoA dehydrogenase n=1 Tax=Vibrio ishigakensis TaxID=1481914 RepID=A0A0B8NU13_9VIBR|nr:acyl-CoA dehydrogenase [Vibrio ishigakensis]